MSEAVTTERAVRLPGVSDEVNDTIRRLNSQLSRLASRNRLLDAYYDAEKNLRSAHGGVVPQQYFRLGLALGWSAKAVDALARRCNLDGMTWADGDLDSLGFSELWDDNRLGAEVDQGITSALIHGPAFVAASRGSDGEPAGLVHFYSALDATGTRNPRTRLLDDLLVVNDRDKQGDPTALTLYLRNETFTAVRDGATWSEPERSPHEFGVPAAVMPYSPRLRKPMGRSRLSRPVRGIQDAALRELVRLEGHMDVYAFPEFWMLGADERIFKDAQGNVLPKWQVMLGRIKGIPDDEDAENPRADVKKFDAASPEPHLAALNAYSKLFARETSLPDSAVAITDFANPTSADSYDASQYELIAEAEGTVDEFSPALRQVVPIALAMQNGYAAVPAEWRSMKCQWRDPRYQSRAALADAGAKQIASVPWLAETEVGLELLGMTPQQIERALADRRRAQGNARLDALLGAQAPVVPGGIAG